MIALMDLKIGIPLPGAVTAKLEKAQSTLEVGDLVPPPCFFVTVADLGEQTRLIADKVGDALGQLRQPPFYLTLDGLGTLGGQRPTEVYAAAVLSDGLKTLHKTVGGLVREAGVSMAYQKYTPHVTLAEFGEMGPHDLKIIMSWLSRRSALSADPFPVTEVCLYAFTETEDGLEQETLLTHKL